MTHASNPAGRLWLFATATAQSSPKANLRQVWSDYFSAETPSQYLASLSEIIALPSLIEEAIDSAADAILPKEILLRGVQPLSDVIHADLSGSQHVQWFNSQVKEGHLNDIQTCSYVLNRVQPHADVTEDALEKIRDLAEEIVSSALGAKDLDPDVRGALIDYAHGLLYACDQYIIRGAAAFTSELDRFIGSAHRVGLRERVPKKLWAQISSISVAVLTAIQIVTAPSDVAGALEAYQGFLQLPASVEAPAPINIPSSPTT